MWAFSASEGHGECGCELVGVAVALACPLDNIYIRFGSGLCGRNVWAPIGADCTPCY